MGRDLHLTKFGGKERNDLQLPLLQRRTNHLWKGLGHTKRVPTGPRQSPAREAVPCGVLILLPTKLRKHHTPHTTPHTALEAGHC